MSTDTRELIEICAQLPEAQRDEVADFARFLLNRAQGATAHQASQQWLESARGAAKAGVTTEQVMSLTRGEP
jgi:hypothetical protein